MRDLIVDVYRKFPLSMDTKMRVKEALFRTLGFAFSHTHAYRRWHEQRELLSWEKRPGNESWSSPADDWSDHWRDYEALKACIHAAMEDQRAHPPQKKPEQTGAGETSKRAGIQVTDVSIVLWGSRQGLLEGASALRQSVPTTVEIILACDSADLEAPDLPKVRVATPSVAGPVAACNAAAHIATGRFLMFLREDFRIDGNSLSALCGELQAEGDKGATCPALIGPDGRLISAGARIAYDGRLRPVGKGAFPDEARHTYSRDLDVCAFQGILIERELFHSLGALDTAYVTSAFAFADLGLKIGQAGRRIRYCAQARAQQVPGNARDVMEDACHPDDRMHLSRTWLEVLEEKDRVRTIAFYLPQYHPIPENDLWWGKGFTEWTNVSRAKPNFTDHYQPRQAGDLGYYDLRAPEVQVEQARLADRYGIDGFCYYYYWFHGKRLLERPVERLLKDDAYQFPFCLCWANENWTRRWDGNEHELLIGQQHSDEDDRKVIADLSRFLTHPAYIRVRGRPLILVYRTDLFPDFGRTVALWREACKHSGIGEIFIARVETSNGAEQPDPSDVGCDASVEFPPHNLPDLAQLAEGRESDDRFVVDYRDAALEYASRPAPNYPRMPGAMPGWDNTARRGKHGTCFHNATPGAFQAWLETCYLNSKEQFSGDERLVFVNAWNEWAEGAYLEPDQKFGHAYLQAVSNARDYDRHATGHPT